jgi:putative copper resistance protein D
MLAASVWVGGLTALVALAIGPTDHEVLILALKRFSAVGLTVVLIILASGLLNAWFLVGSVNALFTTPYGHVLLIKLAFFTAMIGLALYNRLALLPRLAGADDSVTLLLLKRSVAIEQACALAVVAAVSVLGTMEPAFGMKM